MRGDRKIKISKSLWEFGTGRLEKHSRGITEHIDILRYCQNTHPRYKFVDILCHLF